MNIVTMKMAVAAAVMAAFAGGASLGAGGASLGVEKLKSLLVQHGGGTCWRSCCSLCSPLSDEDSAVHDPSEAQCEVYCRQDHLHRAKD